MHRRHGVMCPKHSINLVEMQAVVMDDDSMH